MTTNYFPTHLAMGKAFCNRKAELKQLTANIEGINPVLIMSPRRYGKTSLALNTIKKIGWLYSRMDLYRELSEESIEQAILNGIGVLLGQLETKPKKLLLLMTEFFSSMHVRAVVGIAGGISLEFGKRKKKVADTIFEALEKLHKLAENKGKKVVLFFDEFQIIGEVVKDYSIEAAIRGTAQESTHVAYVFSGSNRHLLQEMFCDKKRPFYKLCNIMRLDRIAEEHYRKHIKKGGKGVWKEELSDEILETIFLLTERHPYYVNKLCSLLILEDAPTVTCVQEVWNNYVLENTSFVERELEFLGLNHRRFLILLSRMDGTKEPFSGEFLSLINMVPGSLSRAIKGLIEKDYVYIDRDGWYRVLDPLIKAVLTSES